MNAMKYKLLILGLCALAGTIQAEVRVWEEDLVLPSYRLEDPDPNPMFYRGESYQGAQKRVYPYALMDGITGDRREKVFKAVYLENEYIKVCVLPEIGGRLLYATDKTNGYNFFYKQNVIKPALIGMLGAWISGGIEWCVFHHHRNTTHMPVDYRLAENPDGSKTLWIGETERRHRMRWIIGMTLFPEKSYIAVDVKMINRTELPHSILYWANVAVHVDENYQILFPPSVHVATYHAKNDFVHWPIGRGFYQRADYTGVDLSWWKNHPHQVSCFAWDLQEDFMGGYDHGREAGVVHVGNHHIVRGAKLWEWAPGNIWDTQILTDSDGPYAELMVGAFSDNQPDYSWIKPYEVKAFTQYWYPVQKIGGFKNANLRAAVNLVLEKGVARVGIQTTSKHDGAKVILMARGHNLFETTTDISPDIPFVEKIPVTKDIKETELLMKILDANDEVLIEYQPKEYEPVDELPETVKAPPEPAQIPTIEELYLTGKRVEQIYKPSIDPMAYFEEALKRDPYDVRTNTTVGILHYKNCDYEKAEEHLRRAVRRMTIDYTRPIDTESFYHLGLVLQAQKKWDEAYDWFYKATWDYAFHSPGYFELAKLSCNSGNLDDALGQIDLSLSTNTDNTRAKNVKAAILRRLDRLNEAFEQTETVLAMDPLDFFAMNEMILSQKKAGDEISSAHQEQLMTDVMRDDVQSYLELATDYMALGFFNEAIDILDRYTRTEGGRTAPFPLVSYYLGYLYRQIGNADKAGNYFKSAAEMDHRYCFPYRRETVDVLRTALNLQPNDARASYYLGNLLYDLQPDRAIALWERAREIDPSLAIVHRNLGWGYLRYRNDIEEAIASYEKAIETNPDDPRYYLELDDLYRRANIEPARRLAMLDKNPDILSKRKDLLIRHIDLSVKNAKYDQAISQLTENRFFISEGGGGELGNAYVDAHLLRGLGYLDNGNPRLALHDFSAASEYPENLSQESNRNERRMAQIDYYIARARAASGNHGAAHKLYRDITQMSATSRQGDTDYYRGLAWKELNRTDKTKEVAEEIVTSARRRLEGESTIDFFAKFGEQQTDRVRLATAHYTLGLGLLLQGKTMEAEKEFAQAVEYDRGHVWAKYQLSSIR